ncbi:MAG: hypothetical protein ABI706_01025 [Ilumatobacteraceae bacterium]
MSDDLAEHLAECRECQATAAEFRATTEALARTTAPPAARTARPTSSGLPDRIVARVDLARRRRDRRRRYTVVAGVAAALLMVVAVSVVRHHRAPERFGERVVLDAAEVRGDATLHTWAWGTQIQLAASGFVPGRHYSVWLERSDGSRVGAGSFIGIRNSKITVSLSSALPSSEAVAIGISESDGGVVVVRAPLA